MKRAFGLFLLLTFLCGVGTAACQTPAPPAPPTPTPPTIELTIAGSSEMTPLLAALIAAFYLRHTDVEIAFQAVNSTFGLDQVRQGTAALGAVAAAPPENMWAAPIALDAVAVIVHPDNPLRNLTAAQIELIFSGQKWRWHELDIQLPQDEIIVISREEQSATRAFFQARMMRNLDVTTTAIVMPGSTAVIDFVAAHPNAIGYVSQGLLTAKVKPVRIENLAPAQSQIAAQTYALVRPWYLVAPQEPSGAIRQFVDFCLSPEGQKIVAQNYAPVRPGHSKGD